MPQYIVGNIFGYRSYKIVNPKKVHLMIGKLWPDSNCWCWGASCLSHAIWMRWSFTRPRASQKASAGFRSTPSQVYIYTYACTHIYTAIHSRGLTRSDLDDTCFKSTLAFSHAFHMCWPELKCNLTLYTLNCWVLKSWDRLNVFEDLWKKRTCSMRQSCDLLSSAPKVPTFHGGLWHVQTCNVETAAERSESIWQGSEWSFVFSPYILSSSRKPWKIWGFSSPWQDWPELQPGASAYLGVCQRCFRISNFWLCDLDPKQCFFLNTFTSYIETSLQ